MKSVLVFSVLIIVSYFYHLKSLPVVSVNKNSSSKESLSSQETIRRAYKITANKPINPKNQILIDQNVHAVEDDVVVEQKAYDEIRSQMLTELEEFQEAKKELDEMILKGSFSEEIRIRNEEFESKAKNLLERQKAVNEAYKRLQDAKEKAISKIASNIVEASK